MDPNRKITKKFTKKFGSKVTNRRYFHRKTGLKRLGYLIILKGLESIGIMRVPVGLGGVERSSERTRGLV